MTFSRTIRFCALALAIVVPTVLFGQFEAATVLGGHSRRLRRRCA
jgi:hypothetical protein